MSWLIITWTHYTKWTKSAFNQALNLSGVSSTYPTLFSTPSNYKPSISSHWHLSGIQITYPFPTPCVWLTVSPTADATYTPMSAQHKCRLPWQCQSALGFSSHCIFISHKEYPLMRWFSSHRIRFLDPVLKNLGSSVKQTGFKLWFHQWLIFRL